MASIPVSHVSCVPVARAPLGLLSVLFLPSRQGQRAGRVPHLRERSRARPDAGECAASPRALYPTSYTPGLNPGPAWRPVLSPSYLHYEMGSELPRPDWAVPPPCLSLSAGHCQAGPFLPSLCRRRRGLSSIVLWIPEQGWLCGSYVPGRQKGHLRPVTLRNAQAP